MGRDPLSPRDLTHVLSRHRGSLRQRTRPLRQRVERREGRQSRCDRIAVYLLAAAAVLQFFTMFFFDIF